MAGFVPDCAVITAGTVGVDQPCKAKKKKKVKFLEEVKAGYGKLSFFHARSYIRSVQLQHW